MQSGPGSNPLTPADQESLRQILKKNDSGGSLSLPSFNVLVTESTDDAEAALKGSSLEEDIGGDREEDVGDFDDVDADVDDEFFDRARNKQTVNPVNIADDSVIWCCSLTCNQMCIVAVLHSHRAKSIGQISTSVRGDLISHLIIL